MPKKLLVYLILALLPTCLFARLDEYTAEKTLYQATRLQKKIIEENPNPQAKDYAAVIDAYRLVVTRYPEWNQKDLVLLVIGDLYSRNEQYAQAKEAYLDIIRAGHEKIMANLPYNANLGARARYKIGINYEAQGNWSEAEKNFQMVTTDYPETMDALHIPLYLAEHYQQAGDSEKAESIYQGALGRYIDIIDRMPQSRLAFAARKLIEKSYQNVRKWEEMAETLREAIRNNPNAKVAFVELAKIYHKQNKTEEAIDAFKKAIERYPDYYEAHLELGKLYNDLGRYDLALEIAEGVLRAQDYNVGAIILKGYANFYKRTYNLALKNLQRAVNLGSKLPEVYNLIGVIQTKFKQYTQAREALEASLKLQPNSAPVHVNLGNLYLAEGILAKAEEEYKLAIKQDKNFLAAYANLATLKIKTNNMDEAIEIYNEMLEVNPQLHLVEYHIGEVYEFKGEHKKAVEIYKKTINNLPTYWETYNNLAYLYADQEQNLDEALSLIQKADELKQNNSSVQDTLGFIYYKMKKYPQAEEAYKKALDLTPKHPYILFHLGLLSRDSGKPAQAKKFFEEALTNGLRGKLAKEAKQNISKL